MRLNTLSILIHTVTISSFLELVKRSCHQNSLRKCKPDVTVMMNPVYCDEIQELLDDLGVNTEIIPVQ
jgi:hypothetical protein